MTGLLLFARLRRLPTALVAMAVIGVGSYLTARSMVNARIFAAQALIPVVLISPLALTIVIAFTMSDPSAEITAISPRSTTALRSVPVGLLLVAGALTLAPLATFGGMVLGYPTAIRNIIGLVGLAAISVPFLPPGFSWSVPFIFSLSIFIWFGASRQDTVIAWPLAPASDHMAWVIASALYLTGMLTYNFHRRWRPLDDVEE